MDPNNGYRYYTARQLDELDTILILKKSGLSLQRIKELLEHYTTESSQKVLREQLGPSTARWKSCVAAQPPFPAVLPAGGRQPPQGGAAPAGSAGGAVPAHPAGGGPLLLREISIATKQCFAQAFQEELPIFFQSGVRVPLERILAKRYTEASTAFLPIEKTSRAGNIQRLLGGCAPPCTTGGTISPLAPRMKGCWPSAGSGG